jgi:hypothetical protein
VSRLEPGMYLVNWMESGQLAGRTKIMRQ